MVAVASLPLTVEQEAIVYRQMAGPTAISVPSVVPISGRLSSDLLVDILSELVEDYFALGVRIGRERGRLIQSRDANPGFAFTAKRVAVPTPREFYDFVERDAMAFTAQPHDLRRDPMLRARLYSGEHDHVLVVSAHHSVCDGYAGDLLAREISDRYAARVLGQEYKRAPDHEGYRTLIGRQTSTPIEILATNARYWAGVLRGMSENHHPSSASGGSDAYLKSVSRTSIQGPELAKLRIQAREHRTTLACYCLGIWAATVGNCTGLPCDTIAVPISSRRRGWNSVVANCVQTLPIQASIRHRSCSAAIESVTLAISNAHSRTRFSIEDLFTALSNQGIVDLPYQVGFDFRVLKRRIEGSTDGESQPRVGGWRLEGVSDSRGAFAFVEEGEDLHLSLAYTDTANRFTTDLLAAYRSALVKGAF